MTACSTPDCNGTIRDGFCDLCGMAPAPEPAASVPAAGPNVPPPQSMPAVPPPGPSVDGQGAATDPGASPPQATATPSSGTPVSRPSQSLGRPSQSLGGPSVPSGRLSTRTGTSARGKLGLGMVEMPVVPYRDPSEAVMEDPVVPEKDRFCGACQEPVGRTKNGRVGLTEGWCSSCGTRFSFTPKLNAGDLVQGQYEVLGCLAHGGLGWIYLARDRNVDDRWVVLKGLLNTGDLEAYQGAAAERSYLAGVEHPNIVKIYNFVRHPDPITGVDTGYIVMEYVGGMSLKQLLVERRKAGGGDEVLPLEQVIAYGLEVLGALGYLHGKNLLFCDFKPDNVIQSEEQIKLIDLGGVRRIGDTTSAVYATPGYRVPEEELRDPGPTVSSDLYTVGRAMAVLSFHFKFVSDHPHSLPPRRTVPLLAQFDSFYRFLCRATHRDPQHRFTDAGAMAEQLTGVLREVLAAGDGHPRPATSSLFGPENFAAASGSVATGDVDWLLQHPDAAEASAALPVPLPLAEDSAAELVVGLSDLPAPELVQTLRLIDTTTPETRLMLVWGLIRTGELQEADRLLDEALRAKPDDWRISWYWALLALRSENYTDAIRRFDALYNYLPGEVAPKLGLALATELNGGNPAPLYETVWNTDHTYVSAAFGLARARLHTRDDRAEAAQVLDSVPQLSSLYLPAQMAAVAARVVGGGQVAAAVTAEDLHDAGARLQALGLTGEARGRMAARILRSALDFLEAGGDPGASGELLGRPFSTEGVRGNLEAEYRGLARYTSDQQDRYALIDRANAVRPMSLV